MLLIRISGKDYTFSREAWAALVGATNSAYVSKYDIASFYPSLRPARGQNLTVENLSLELLDKKLVYVATC